MKKPKDINQRGPSNVALVLPIFLVGAGLAGYAYHLYGRLQQSEALRYNFSKIHPRKLAVYYKFAELKGDPNTREIDKERWKYRTD